MDRSLYFYVLCRLKQNDISFATEYNIEVLQKRTSAGLHIVKINTRMPCKLCEPVYI